MWRSRKDTSVSDSGNQRSLTGWVARLTGLAWPARDEPDPESSPDGVVHRSRALPHFLKAMRHRAAPVLVDLGPAIGENVTLLGDQLGCKVHIEHLFGDGTRSNLDRRASENCADLPIAFAYPANSIDGVLCWDVLDYLSPAAAGRLVAELSRVLKPGGVGMAIFTTNHAPEPGYRKYVIVDVQHLRQRDYPAATGPRRLWTSRDVHLMMSKLEVDESYLLKHRQRETLFHKPIRAGDRG
ncbi:MAG: class I SAM-dependent methyltransferase [Acidobacteriota bacterium]